MAQQYRHKDQLKNAKYRNWVKAGLGLKYLKDGLEGFSEDKVKEQHHYILDAVKQKHNLTIVGCGQCSLKKLQPDHIRNKYKKCPLDHKDCNCQYPGGKIACPNNVCGAIYDQIIQNHASVHPAPCWTNTDVQKWCTDAWEVAKCFINAPGYASKLNASQIDCTGLLHLFINSKYLRTTIQCKITGNDVFSKTRSARNSIFHSHSMELEDFEVNGYIDDMISVLEDGKELINRPESKAAVQKLEEIKNTNFVISTLSESEAMAEIGMKVTELKETVEKATNEIQLARADILQVSSTANDELKAKAQHNNDMIEKSGDAIKKSIELQGLIFNAEAQTKTVDCQTVINKRKLEACDEIESVKKAAIESLSQEEKIIYTRERMDTPKVVEPLKQDMLLYSRSKEDLKRSLIDMYTENAVKVSPILLQPDESDVPVSELYVDPLINVLPISQKEKNANSEGKKLQSYREIFTEGDKRHKLIYLIGEAGSGKSTFCINMINSWCMAHSEHQAECSENIQEMKGYELLFYLPLRHESTHDHVEDMIMTNYGDPIIKEVLKKEPEICLILLDGLDEWVLEATKVSRSLFQSKGLPQRDLRKAYTIITTSRPWKFDSVGVRNTEIHRKLQLHGINDIKSMAKKTIDALNEMFNASKNVSDFEADLVTYKIDKEMTLKPMILQQLVYLWFGDKLRCVGKTAIYSNIMSLLFEWTAQRHTDSNASKDLKENLSNIDTFHIPEQCQTGDICPKLKYVMKHIGHLAYATLFLTTKRESSLTFDNSTFERLQTPNEAIDYCLKSGIITQKRSICLGLNRRKHLSFSFVHKSLQEFLCALYIFSELKQRSPHLFRPFILHSIDKKIECFREYFKGCKTADDILEQSNVFIFLCGFDTYLAAHISKFVYNIVVVDDNFVNYRSNVAHERFKKTSFEMITITGALDLFMSLNTHGHRANIFSIQNLILTCIEEAHIHEAVPGKLFFLADFGYKVFGLYGVDLKLSKYIKYINMAFILSLNIEIDCSKVSFTILLSEFLNDPFLGPKMTTLKLNFSGFGCTNDNDIIAIVCNLLTRSRCFLKFLLVKIEDSITIEFPSTVDEIVGFVLRSLPSMNKLETIKLENLDINFSQIMQLSEWLNNSKHLRQISLRKISDHTDDDVLYRDSPYVNLSHHHELEFLDYDFHTIVFEQFSVRNLESCWLHLQNYYILKTSFELLKQSRKLKYAYLSGTYLGWSYCDKVEKVTRNYQKLLPNLTSLKRLQLDNFKFSENIIVEPLKMQNLGTLKLIDIFMQDECWDDLLDSVVLFPKNVRVEVRTSFDGLPKCFWRRRQHQFHNVECNYYYIAFSTKPCDDDDDDDDDDDAQKQYKN